MIVKSVLDGIDRSQGASGMDLGASEEVVEQAITEEEVSSEAAAVEETPAAAPATVDLKGFTGLEAPEGEADDLKKIDGVGPVIEKKLNELGIYHFKQIATLSKEQANAIDEAIAFKGRIERDDWLGQATKLQEA